MFKDIQRGLAKFFSPKMLLILIISIIAIWGLMSYNGQMKIVRDMMEDGTDDKDDKESSNNNDVEEPQPSSGKPETEYALQPIANPSDLLPKDKNSEWNNLNPTSISDEGVKTPDVIEAGYHVGAISQSLRNANLQLRSDPVISKVDIGPWNQSTIDANTTRQTLEIGQA